MYMRSIWWLVPTWPLVLSYLRQSGEDAWFWNAGGPGFFNGDRNGLSFLTSTCLIPCWICVLCSQIRTIWCVIPPLIYWVFPNRCSSIGCFVPEKKKKSTSSLGFPMSTSWILICTVSARAMNFLSLYLLSLYLGILKTNHSLLCLVFVVILLFSLKDKKPM